MKEGVFTAQYKPAYGYSFSPQKPDYGRCAEHVFPAERGAVPHQCQRKNGFGPEGAWCKQHDPDALKIKRLTERGKGQRRIAAAALLGNLKREQVDIINQIAAGHNDPRSLCADFLERQAAANRDAIESGLRGGV